MHFDLQTTFYSLGIIFMSLSILLLIGLVVLVFYIWKKVTQMQKMIEGKIEDISSRPGEIAGEIGAKVVGEAVKKAQSYFRGKR
jgi:uncharacterized membrane protein